MGPGGRPKGPKCDDGSRPTCSDGSAPTCDDGSAPVFDGDMSTKPCADNSKPNNCPDEGRPDTCADGSSPSFGRPGGKRCPKDERICCDGSTPTLTGTSPLHPALMAANPSA